MAHTVDEAIALRKKRNKKTTVDEAIAARTKRIEYQREKAAKEVAQRYKSILKESESFGKEDPNFIGPSSEHIRLQNATDEANALKDYISRNRHILGEYASKGIDRSLDKFSDALDSYKEGFDIRSQFGTKEEFDSAVRQSKWNKEYSAMTPEQRGSALKRLEAQASGKLAGSGYSGDEYEWLKAFDEYQKLLEFDTDAGQKEIDELDRIAKEYTMVNDEIKRLERDLEVFEGDERAISITKEALDKLYARKAELGDYGDDIHEYINEKRMYSKQASDTQSLAGYEAYRQNEDFAERGIYDPNNDDAVYAYINDDDRNKHLPTVNYNYPLLGDEASREQAKDKNYHWMEDSEKEMYNYLYATMGEEEAQKYLDALQYTLNTREAGYLVKDNDTLLEKLFFAGEAGIDQFVGGLRSLFDEQYALTPSATQMASGQIRENMDGVGGVLYDVINTTANQAPTIITSIGLGYINPALGAYVGQGLMGASAAGNAYAQMKQLGYTNEQSASYGILVGASEVVLEKVLGGVSALGGMSSKTISNLTKGLDKASHRIAVQFGASALSEAGEEALQSILEQTIIREIALGESANLSDVEWGEVAYSALLGGISGGVLEGATNIAPTEIARAYNQNQAYKSAGNTVIEADGTGSLLAASETYLNNLENKNAPLQKAFNEASKKQSAKNVGKLATKLDESRVATSKSDIESRLRSAGIENDNLVGTASLAIYKAMSGEELSNFEYAIVTGEDTVNSVYRALMESDANRSYRSYANKLYTPSTELTEATGEAETSSVSADKGTTEMSTQGEYEVPENVPIEVKSTKKNASFGEFVTRDDGTLAVKTKDGTEVDVKDVSFDGSDVGIVYEAVSSIDGITSVEANALANGYRGDVSPSEYAMGIKEAYAYGRYGMPQSQLAKSAFAYILSETARNNAYEMGKMAEEGKEISTNEEGIRVRNSSKRTGGKNTEGQVSSVEEKAGRAESRKDGVRSRDRQTTSLTYGEKVSSKGLGIADGKTSDNVRAVTDGETESMKKAKSLARERGLDVVFFAGDNLHFENGTDARAFIKGKKVYVRVDHDLFTAEQLMRHEIGHDMIAEGEVDVDAVRDRIKEMYGEENLDELSKLYASAYDGTGMTAEEIWEEIICDSLGDMNIFVEKMANGSDLFAATNLLRIKDEVKASTKAERAPPSSGKTSGKVKPISIPGTNKTLSQTYVDDILDSFGIISIGDYEHVQEKVFDTLQNEGFFTENNSRSDTNEQTGMVIETNKSGIDETFCDKNYRSLGRFKKIIKLATVREIPNAIKNGTLVADNVPNAYGVNRGTKYAYLVYDTIIDGTEISIKITIRKSRQKNKFWVHSFEAIKKVNDLPDGVQNNAETGLRTADDVTIPQNKPGVKTDSGKTSREIRVSDSDGNLLTEEQQEYFKDSMVRDANGNLLVVYHGTDAEFNVFDFSRIGKNGKAEGFGFYFSDDKEITGRYGDIQKKVYLNITKPLLKTKRTMTKAQYAKLVNALVDFDVSQYDDDELMWQDTFISNYVYTYGRGMTKRLAAQEFVNQVWDFNENDVDLVYELANGSGKVHDIASMREFYDVLTDTLGYDGIVAEWENNEGVSRVYVTFNSEQSKNVNNKNPTSNPDLRYSREIRPSDVDLSPRAVLADALEAVAQNEAEAENLRKYKAELAKIEKIEEELRQQKAEIKEMSFAKGTRDQAYKDKLSKLRLEAQQNQNRIDILDKRLLRLEAAKPLKDLLERERAKVRKRDLEKYRALMKESHDKQIESMDKRSARGKVQKLILETTEWLNHPKKTDVKCPDFLKAPYLEFLENLIFPEGDTPTDIASKSLRSGKDMTKQDLKFLNALNSLANSIEAIQKTQDATSEDNSNVPDEAIQGFLDLPQSFVNELRVMAENIDKAMKIGDFNLIDMSSADFKEIAKKIRTLNHAIRELSTLYSNARFANIEELGAESIDYFESLGRKGSKIVGEDFLNWDNVLPYYAFKKFGDPGLAVFSELQGGQDKLAFHAKSIFDFKEKTWTDKEAKAWAEETHSIEISTGTIELAATDIMTIYCLSKREQAQGHLYGDGIKLPGKRKGLKETIETGTKLTENDVQNIIGALSKRQIEVADAIQRFMSTVCAEWGNEISMKRFLTKEFTEANYFPIETTDDGRPVKDQAVQQADLYRLLNISATKETVKNARNAVVIHNIFEVFAGHTSDMAKLNAFGLPLLDFMKWINYNQLTDGDKISLRAKMRDAFGEGAKKYALNLIKDVNGRYTDNPDHPWFMQFMRTTKAANVGSSGKVALLQFTAYPRASMVLSKRSLALALFHKLDRQSLSSINKMQKYSGIALWKSFGFYDTNIARSVEAQIAGKKNWKETLIELGFKLPEIADTLTWGALWNACEHEIARANKNMSTKSEEFYKAVAEKFREVIYATQVVDSVLTRSQLMRNKSGVTQTFTAYMSEPTVAANILMDAAWEVKSAKRRGVSTKAAWSRFGRAAGVYGVCAIVQALAGALVDAYRDDDEEKKFWEKYVAHLKENAIQEVNPFNKIPFLSDISELISSKFGIGYFSTDSMTHTWLANSGKAFDAWKALFDEDSDKTLYNAIYETSRFISSATGVSVSNAMREAVDLWNKVAGAIDDDLKIRKSDLSKKQNINRVIRAEEEGNSTESKAIFDEIISEYAEDKYADLSEQNDKLPERDRKSESQIREEATSAVKGDFKSIIGTLYKDGDMDKDTATMYLRDYFGKTDNEVYWIMEEWDYGKQYGSSETYSKYSVWYDAIWNGEGLREEMRRHIEHTDTKEGEKRADFEERVKSTLAGRITEHFKPLFIGAETTEERARIKARCLWAYEVLGYKRSEKGKDIDAWLKDE